MNSDTHQVNHERCSRWDDAGRLEWLVVNGRGGFAMSSISQMLTRRYHGLLIAAVAPPVDRFVLLAKLDAAVTVAGRTYELATNSYVGAVEPHGYRFLSSFDLRPFPTWRWSVGGAIIEQTLCMAEGEDTTFVRYRLIQANGPAAIHVQPLGTSRHFHHLAQCRDIPSPAIRTDGDRLLFEWPDGRPSWQLSHNGTFQAQLDWYYQFFLAVEAERGYDFKQDLFTPGPITATLRPDDETGLVFAASTQARSWREYQAAFDRAAAGPIPGISAPAGPGSGRAGSAGASPPRRSCPGTPGSPSPEDPLAHALMHASADFLAIRGNDLKTVIAGYPWFTDWGRDTFISLPGLCLVPGRLDDARKIILAFAAHVDSGMIPNRFPDFGEPPQYNTVDATLWYIHAVDRYLTYSGDWDFIAERMFSIIAEIIEAHERGTRHGIRLTQDGLLAAGEHGFALTWMDARAGDHSFTPRIGKPVEIAALWYNALCIASNYADRLGRTEQAGHWRNLAARCQASFNERFWNAATGCLYDVVDVDHQSGIGDGAIRPNQLFAVSLTHSVLHQDHWPAVVDVCQRELLTPIGPRTLSPSDPAYRGRYEGDLITRDSAYHQGTVWPWLIGAFITAYVKAHGGNDVACSEARRFLDGLTAHLSEAGLGSISEVADGDAPHRPAGCPWQAWSVAEPLRALCEDILRTHPHGAQPAARSAATARAVACPSS